MPELVNTCWSLIGPSNRAIPRNTPSCATTDIWSTHTQRLLVKLTQPYDPVHVVRMFVPDTHVVQGQIVGFFGALDPFEVVVNIVLAVIAALRPVSFWFISAFCLNEEIGGKLYIFLG